MAIEKLNNTTFNKGVGENFQNRVKESGYLAQKKTKPMVEHKKEGVVQKGFKIDKKA
jgi:hypothetical protein